MPAGRLLATCRPAPAGQVYYLEAPTAPPTAAVAAATLQRFDLDQAQGRDDRAPA